MDAFPCIPPPNVMSLLYVSDIKLNVGSNSLMFHFSIIYFLIIRVTYIVFVLVRGNNAPS